MDRVDLKLEVSVSAVAAFSRDGRVFRAFGHLMAAGAGSLLCVPLALAGGNLRHTLDVCPVPWEEVVAVLYEPAHEPAPLTWEAMAVEFPLLAQIAPEPWRSDWLDMHGGLSGSCRRVLRLVHDSGIRYAMVRS